MPKDDWEGVPKPFIGQIVWHYKTADRNSPNAKAPAMVTKIGVNYRIAGLRFIHGGAYTEPFQSSVHMDHLIGPDGVTEMTPLQRQHAGGWEYTDVDQQTNTLVAEVAQLQKVVEELRESHNTLIDIVNSEKERLTKAIKRQTITAPEPEPETSAA